MANGWQDVFTGTGTTTTQQQQTASSGTAWLTFANQNGVLGSLGGAAMQQHQNQAVATKQKKEKPKLSLLDDLRFEVKAWLPELAAVRWNWLPPLKAS